jgi:tetratricopeptide (TPR) repeat protein
MMLWALAAAAQLATAPAPGPAAPAQASAYVERGAAFVAAGEPEKAVASFERALRIHPGDAAALAGLALAYATLNDPRTDQTYRKAIAADPRRLRLSVELADYLWRERQYDAGNARIEKVLREMPDNTELRVYYGVNLADQRRYVDAAKQFDEARRRGLATAEVLLYLGSALREAGRLEEATTRLREAVALAPDRAAPHQSLGRVLLFRGQPAEAAAELERAARLDPSSALIAIDLGRAYEASGKTAQAEAAYRRALELQPDLALTHYTLGTLLARAGQREEAAAEIALYQEYFQKVQDERHRSSSRQVELNLGWTELQAGRPNEALAQFSRYPNDVEGMIGAAESLSKLGRHDEAVRTLERARLLDPESRSLAWELDRERAMMEKP